VDRLGFKKASVVADLASGATVAAIPLLYHTIGLAFWQLLVLVFAGGFLDARGLSARQSIVPDLARRAGMRIERANFAFEGIAHFSSLLGPPLAGILIITLTPSNVLIVDAASFAFSAAVVGALVPSPATRGVEEGAGEAGGPVATSPTSPRASSSSVGIGFFSPT
jgi:MFS family permease